MLIQVYPDGRVDFPDKVGRWRMVASAETASGRLRYLTVIQEGRHYYRSRLSPQGYAHAKYQVYEVTRGTGHNGVYFVCDEPVMEWPVRAESATGAGSKP